MLAHPVFCELLDPLKHCLKGLLGKVVPTAEFLAPSCLSIDILKGDAWAKLSDVVLSTGYFSKVPSLPLQPGTRL